MTSHYLHMVATPSVKDAQRQMGSRHAYARHDDAAEPDALTEAEAAFIAARDGFYMASVGESGWPYMQFRGGAPGFVKIVGPREIAFANFRGNRQYVSLGNLTHDNRVALFFMDYANKRRLKVLGRVRFVDLDGAPELAAALIDPNYRAHIEHGVAIEIEAFDWNCPQHITPRYTIEEIAPEIDRLKARIAELEAAGGAGGAA